MNWLNKEVGGGLGSDPLHSCHRYLSGRKLLTEYKPGGFVKCSVLSEFCSQWRQFLLFWVLLPPSSWGEGQREI